MARDGTVTQYTYDERGNKTAQTSPGAGSTGSSWTYYTYNANDRLLTEMVTGASTPLRSLGYSLDGSLTTETNALGGVTTYVEAFDSGNQRYTRTTTYPDGGTRIETHFLDGRLERITGTAVAGKRYEYGVEQMGTPWCRTTKVIDLDAAGNDMSQWVKTYTDAAGRVFRTEYAAAATPYPYEENTYNDKGQRIKHRDPDGVITLFSYNAQGQLEYEALDMDRDDVIDFDGTDQITRTIINGDGASNRETLTYVLETDGSAVESLVQKDTQTLNTHTSIRYQDATNGIQTSTSTTYDAPNRTRTVTTTHPGLNQTEQVYVDDLLRTTRALDTSSQTIHQMDSFYDGQGRLNRQEDSTSGPTVYTYNDAELLATVTTGVGATQTTSTLYDTKLQPITRAQPDGQTIHYEYELSGQLKKTYGARTYPVEYTYDAQGRLSTQTTWSDYAGTTEARTTRWNYEPNRGWLESIDAPDEATGQPPATPGTGGVKYFFSTAGRVIARKWERGAWYLYGRNNAGQVTAATGNPSTNYTYNRRNQLASTTQDGMTTSLTYNLAGQITDEVHTGGQLDGLSVHHSYDGAGRRTQTQLKSGPTTVNTVDYVLPAKLRS